MANEKHYDPDGDRIEWLSNELKKKDAEIAKRDAEIVWLKDVITELRKRYDERSPEAPGPKDEDDPCGDCGNSYSFEICHYCLRLKLHPIRFSTMKDNWRPKPSKSTEETPVAPADKKEA